MIATPLIRVYLAAILVSALCQTVLADSSDSGSDSSSSSSSSSDSSSHDTTHPPRRPPHTHNATHGPAIDGNHRPGRNVNGNGAASSNDQQKKGGAMKVLLPLLVAAVIIAVIVTTACCCYRRRQAEKTKAREVQQTEPIEVSSADADEMMRHEGAFTVALPLGEQHAADSDRDIVAGIVIDGEPEKVKEVFMMPVVPNDTDRI
jgi:hypothetical protein